MFKFNPKKLKVIYRDEVDSNKLEIQRMYTLTHSDRTGN